MRAAVLAEPKQEVFYPESDGLPMSDNTRQFRWIITLTDNLTALFRDREDVFVSGNQFWYPVERENQIVASPDVYVVFGRPKGHRSSYKQWEEDDIPLTVVFEVWSPSNDGKEQVKKFLFYEEQDVAEYYTYYPQKNTLRGWVRGRIGLMKIWKMNGHVSPRLGIRFGLSEDDLEVYYPDGRPFVPFDELEAERQQLQQRAVLEQKRAQQAEQRAEKEKQRADREKQRAEKEKQRADRLADLSRKVLRQVATPEEIQELSRLLQSPN